MPSRLDFLSAAAIGALALAVSPPPVPSPATFQYAKMFGTGISQGYITQQETELYSYNVSSSSSYGVVTHWWITGGASVDYAIISFYIDGEQEPSLQFVPYLACGVGFDDDTQAPWSTRWFGKGAKSGGWFNNFRIPFQQSMRVTYRAGPGQPNDVIYMIVRGAENVPISIGGIPIPTTARLGLQITNATFQPLEYVPILSVKSGTGMFWMQTLTFTAGNLNTLEGCYHAFIPYNSSWEQRIDLSTGTEDYFDSAYYFNGGQFTGENSGFTHYKQESDNTVTFSAYRFHETDPLMYQDGIQILWRDGDATDPATGLKCRIQQGGNVVGSPTAAEVVAYAWYYYW